MKAIDILRMRNPSAASGHLDTQSVTTGASGVASDRFRGYSTVEAIGSISDGTANVASGLPIDEIMWSENGDSVNHLYVLTIAGASNSGWTTLTIGAKVLTRASASFSSGRWTWATTDGVVAQAFGSNGSSVTVYFD